MTVHFIDQAVSLTETLKTGNHLLWGLSLKWTHSHLKGAKNIQASTNSLRKIMISGKRFLCLKTKTHGGWGASVTVQRIALQIQWQCSQVTNGKGLAHACHVHLVHRTPHSVMRPIDGSFPHVVNPPRSPLHPLSPRIFGYHYTRSLRSLNQCT